MTKHLHEALKKRRRVWGQQNAAVLDRMRSGKAQSRYWPIRPYRALGCGAFLIRIPSAA